MKQRRRSTDFWKRVNKTETCWLWTGWVDRDGYGKCSRDGEQYVHRWTYKTLVGPIPDGYVIDHLCRVKRCVRPDHLEPVTPGENTLRMMRSLGRFGCATHCPKGHPYDEENTYVSPSGRRHCRECNRVRCRRDYYARKAAAAARESA